jgi:uncharacterized protein YsxB (DUF464 family)
MIQATYYRKYNRLTVTGHANSAEHGHDLVCASASMLAYTLAANVANMADHGQVRNPVIKNNEGDTEISCSPRHNLKASVTLVFDSVCVGFDLLAHDYPEFVKYEIRG